ncbi:MAG: hypothetical protein WCD45_04070, partial [Gallionella sp.]
IPHPERWKTPINPSAYTRQLFVCIIKERPLVQVALQRRGAHSSEQKITVKRNTYKSLTKEANAKDLKLFRDIKLGLRGQDLNL